MSNFVPSAAYMDTFRSLPALRLFVPFSQNFWASSLNYTVNMTLDGVRPQMYGSGWFSSLGTEEDNVYMNFDGSTDYCYVGRGVQYNPNLIDGWVHSDIRGMTLGCWFRPDAAPSGTGQLISRRQSPNDLCYELRRDASGNIAFGISTSGTSWYKILTTSGGPTTDVQWYFVIAQIKQTEMRIFINGEWWSTTSGIPSTIFQSGTSATLLAARQLGVSTTSGHLDGRLSNCFLTASYLPKGLVENLWHITREGFRL